MRRVAQLSVWVAAVLGTALVIAFATSNAASPDRALAPNDGPSVRPPPVPGAEDPADPGAADAAQAPGRRRAAPADVAASLSLVKNDAVFRKILDSIDYSVADSQPWLSSDGETQLGTELDLELDSPLSGPARLPGVRFNDNGKSYRHLMLNAAVSGATTLTVFVDLQSQRVVSVMPPDSTWRATRSASSKSMARPGASFRGSGGTAKTQSTFKDAIGQTRARSRPGR